MTRLAFWMLVWLITFSSSLAAEAQNVPPPAFTPLFNGRDLSGWHGMGTFDIRRYAVMSKECEPRSCPMTWPT